MQGSALTQGPAQQTTGISAGAVLIPPEELGLGVGSQRGESKQVSHFDPRQRPIRIRRHAAILSRQLPDPSDAATSGVRHESEMVPMARVAVHLVAGIRLWLRILAAGPVCGCSGRAGPRSMSVHAVSQSVLTTARSLLTWAGTAGQSVKSL